MTSRAENWAREVIRWGALEGKDRMRQLITDEAIESCISISENGCYGSYQLMERHLN